MIRSLTRGLVRYALRPALSPSVSIAFQRKFVQLATKINRPPAGMAVAQVNLNGVPCEKLTVKENSGTVLLYFHGGAFCVGSPVSHRALAARIAEAAGATAYVPDYRLAPEHPFPAALDDALQVYLWLLDAGHDARRIVVAGDSAGGGLALSLVLRLRDEKLPLPTAMALISPVTDMTLSGESISAKAAADPMLREGWLRECYAHYAGKTSLRHPLLSPLFADLGSLPPTMIHVGSDEILLDDSNRFSQESSSVGNEIELRVFEGLWHEFHVHAPLLPESGPAIAELGAFLEKHTRS